MIMTNSDTGQGLYYEILRGMASEFGWASYMPIEKTMVVLDQNRMMRYEGTYLLDGRIKLQFSVEDDHLSMATASNSYHLYPENDTKFFDIDFGFSVDFTRDDSGEVVGAVLNRGGVINALSKVG